MGPIKKKKRACPCCGYYTLDEPQGNNDICPVCFWEDDPVDLMFPDEKIGWCNEVGLNQAKKNYLAFGACHESMIKNVRKPKQIEMQPHWESEDE